MCDQLVSASGRYLTRRKRAVTSTDRFEQSSDRHAHRLLSQTSSMGDEDGHGRQRREMDADARPFLGGERTNMRTYSTKLLLATASSVTGYQYVAARSF